MSCSQSFTLSTIAPPSFARNGIMNIFLIVVLCSEDKAGCIFAVLVQCVWCVGFSRRLCSLPYGAIASCCHQHNSCLLSQCQTYGFTFLALTPPFPFPSAWTFLSAASFVSQTCYYLQHGWNSQCVCRCSSGFIALCFHHMDYLALPSQCTLIRPPFHLPVSMIGRARGEAGKSPAPFSQVAVVMAGQASC